MKNARTTARTATKNQLPIFEAQDWGVDAYEINLSPAAGPVTNDVPHLGLPARATLTSPAQEYNAGASILVLLQAQEAGVVTVETSPDHGRTWDVCVHQAIPDGRTHVGEVTPEPGTTDYRFRFQAGSVGVPALWISSQQAIPPQDI